MNRNDAEAIEPIPYEKPVADEAPEVENAEPVSTGLTARVADSYGPNPHEHKPSQDPWDADTAEEKQAETGVTEWPGKTSSESSENNSDSSPKTDGDSIPAPSAENPSAKVRKGSGSARSTATK